MLEKNFEIGKNNYLNILLLHMAVVLDFGTRKTKIGVAGPSSPNHVFNTIVGTPTFDTALTAMVASKNNQVFAHEAISKAGVLDVEYPIRNGVVTNWEKMEDIMDYCLSDVLGFDDIDAAVILSVPPFSSRNQNRKYSQILLESFNAKSICLVPESTLSCYAYNIHTGLVVSSGAGVTHTLPVYKGYPLYYAVQRANMGGNNITEILVEKLQCMGAYLTSSSELEIANAIKEQKTKVPTYEKVTQEILFDMAEYMLPDGNIVQLGFNEIYCPKALFDFYEFGMDEGSLDTIVKQTVGKCPIDARRELLSNVYLAGGNTKIEGFSSELKKKLKSVCGEVNVVNEDKRIEFCAWTGGSVLGMMEQTLEAMSLSLECYNEIGLQDTGSKTYGAYLNVDSFLVNPLIPI